MKKLMTLMLGLSLALGCVATAFAQDTTAKKSSKKKASKKKAPKKAATTKKEG
jgi:F0F1-type ATP synthase membrane subunit c/vacuolar-type H+-ATPase subunit K